MRLGKLAVFVVYVFVATGCSILKNATKEQRQESPQATSQVEKAVLPTAQPPKAIVTAKSSPATEPVGRQQPLPAIPPTKDAAVDAPHTQAHEPKPQKIIWKHPDLLVTFDDFPCQRESRLKKQKEINQKIIAILKKYDVHTIVFANASMMMSHVEECTDMLREWVKNGHLIGNHTYSHQKLSKTDLLEYEMDIIRGEPLLKKVLAEYGQKLTYFRYPYLDYGSGKEKAGVAKFLEARGYEVVGITIDSLDWLYNARIKNDDASAYLAHVRKQLMDHFGKNEREIIIFHINAINAENFETILKEAKALGYKLV
ncbi:MAG: polysaccharide deacetylase family protein [Holosporales bacterium]|jgi:peptidoglycan/xylan/chitin deacetylase (PgdA/CDA1 family)|nr:polysaccharide deacetylase family protein [Holosporales bacterium]